MSSLVMNILIFLTQVMGVVLVGTGLAQIWTPLAWLYSGAALFVFGHVLYRAMKSEEFEK